MLRCPLCGRLYRNLGALVYHFYREHLDWCRCPCCGATVSNIVAHAWGVATSSSDVCHALLYMAARSTRINRRLSRLVLEAARARQNTDTGT